MFSSTYFPLASLSADKTREGRGSKVPDQEINRIHLFTPQNHIYQPALLPYVCVVGFSSWIQVPKPNRKTRININIKLSNKSMSRNILGRAFKYERMKSGRKMEISFIFGLYYVNVNALVNTCLP